MGNVHSIVNKVDGACVVWSILPSVHPYLSDWVLAYGQRYKSIHWYGWLTLLYNMTDTRRIQARNRGEVCACTLTNNGVTLVTIKRSVWSKHWTAGSELQNLLSSLVNSSHFGVHPTIRQCQTGDWSKSSSRSSKPISGRSRYDQFKHCTLSAIVQAVINCRQLSHEVTNLLTFFMPILKTVPGPLPSLQSAGRTIISCSFHPNTHLGL